MHDTFSYIGAQGADSDANDQDVSESISQPRPLQPELLIVDDDLSCAHFLSHAAEECGYSARICLSPDEFRRVYRSSPPKAVLVDLSMPQGDGVELLRFLAEQRCTAKVILTSGVGTRVLEAAMRLGAALGLQMGKVLPKPFVIHDLSVALSSVPHEQKEASSC